MIARVVEGIGRGAREAVEGVGRAGRFGAESAAAIRDVSAWCPQTAQQAFALGVRSVPLGAFIAVFTGIVLALLASYSISGAIPLYFVGTLVEKTITMELAPVLTGLALAGRVGANIAAELGTMRVTEQIDALETLAYDPHAHLVVPRVVAGTVMFPVVVAAAMLIGVASGWLAFCDTARSVVAGVRQRAAPLFFRVRRALWSNQVRKLRRRGDLRRVLHRTNHRGRSRRSWTLGDSRCGLLGNVDPTAGRILGCGSADWPGAGMKRGNDLVVGVAIVAVAAATLAATFWLKQADLRRRDELVARFRDVGNARIGTPLVIRGVRSGRLQQMELVDSWVHVTFSLDRDVAVPRDPVVLLNESSLFGEWQATVLEQSALPRDADVNRQVRESGGLDGVVPGAKLPDIAQLTAVAGRIAGDVASLADRVDTAFDAAAARELRLSIRNFAQMSTVLSDAVRKQSVTLGEAAQDVRIGVRSLVAASDRVREVAARFDSSTGRGEVRRIVEDAGEAARQLREASGRVLRLSGQLDSAQMTLVSLLARGDSVMRQVQAGRGTVGLFLNDSSVYLQTDSLLIQLRLLVADIQANPRKYLKLSVF